MVGHFSHAAQQTDLYVGELVNHVNALLGKRQRNEMDVENMNLKQSIQQLTDEIEILQKEAESARAEAEAAEEEASASKKTLDETLSAADQVLDDGETEEAADIVEKSEADTRAHLQATAVAKKKQDEARDAQKKLADTHDKKRSLRSRLQAVKQAVDNI